MKKIATIFFSILLAGVSLAGFATDDNSDVEEATTHAESDATPVEDQNAADTEINEQAHDTVDSEDDNSEDYSDDEE